MESHSVFWDPNTGVWFLSSQPLEDDPLADHQVSREGEVLTASRVSRDAEILAQVRMRQIEFLGTRVKRASKRDRDLFGRTHFHVQERHRRRLLGATN